MTTQKSFAVCFSAWDLNQVWWTAKESHGLFVLPGPSRKIIATRQLPYPVVSERRKEPADIISVACSLPSPLALCPICHQLQSLKSSSKSSAPWSVSKPESPILRQHFEGLFLAKLSVICLFPVGHSFDRSSPDHYPYLHEQAGSQLSVSCRYLCR